MRSVLIDIVHENLELWYLTPSQQSVALIGITLAIASGRLIARQLYGSEPYDPRSKQWMINFRVRDLDAMVAQLKRAGIAVEVDPR